MKTTSSQGFSLLELIVAMSLTLFAVTISTTEFSKLFRYLKLRQQTRQVIHLLEQAKALTANTQVSTNLHISDSKLSLQQVGSDSITRSLTLSAPFSVTLPVSGITMYPNQVNTPASLIVSSGNSYCKVTLSLRGRIAERCL